ncbi:LysR family transcriptional regulator [Pseudovibrio exalbescens]|uniref:LysR family transcriptional regulator n=1 Tax=Pseudovibrio exalbescens TaxID=197461 RepID=UPI002364FFF4|nr:LysR family transcriptional regulator [Pseudovibrio exalbescens]MDD7910817.1 LysR family transcriptional regulator [Pseudovibrio exalbescens]
MSFDLKSIQLFTRIAALGQIGAAGREFRLSPTSATQRIKALENVLGTRLLNRSTRSVSLTPDGEAFLRHATNIVASMDEAYSELSGEAEVSGTLRVTSSATFGRLYIMPHLRRFMDLHPKLELELNLSDTVLDMVEGGFDLALRIGVLRDSQLLAKKLAPCRRVLVASPCYLEKHPPISTPADLSVHECLVDGYKNSWRFRHPDGREENVRVSGRFKSNIGEAFSAAALDGFGIAALSLWHAHEALKQGALRVVLPEVELLPDWNIYAVQTSTGHTPARVRVFREFMEAELKLQQPIWEEALR